MGFDIQLLLGGNNIPCAELGEHCFDCLVFVPYVVLLEFLDILRVDGRGNGFGRHRVDYVLEGILLPLDLLVLLELEEISTLGDVLNYWVEGIWFLEPLAVQVAFPGGRSHFGLAEDKREEPVLPTPFGCREMARKCCELLDKVFHGVEGGFLDNGVKGDGFHLSSHHFSYDGHICCDRRHGCAVHAL